ncbi:uncharacterized protein UTRI_01995 [Ustilago trichophora]|uniref:Uncharacterized protein n=1 Tax=Ustilago trichophora TaxID=86804 RepID=A0A5C3E184_9BASI|nr:uncharacterized protein UTRI_01995 [Ustilago trichophora]
MPQSHNVANGAPTSTGDCAAPQHPTNVSFPCLIDEQIDKQEPCNTPALLRNKAVFRKQPQPWSIPTLTLCNINSHQLCSSNAAPMHAMPNVNLEISHPISLLIVVSLAAVLLTFPLVVWHNAMHSHQHAMPCVNPQTTWLQLGFQDHAMLCGLKLSHIASNNNSLATPQHTYYCSILRSQLKISPQHMDNLLANLHNLSQT